MRFKIGYTLPNLEEDFVIIEGDTLEKIRELALIEVEKRSGTDPWSQEL